MQFGRLILRKISKIGATRCQILRLKCTKFDFRWGSALDPAEGAYSAPQTPYLYLRGLLLTGKEEKGEGRGRKGGGKRKERGGEGKGEERGRRGQGVIEGPPISCWHRAPRRVNPALCSDAF